MAIEFYVKVTRSVPWSALRDRIDCTLQERIAAPVRLQVGDDPETLTIGEHELHLTLRADNEEVVDLSVSSIPEDPAEPLDTGWSAHVAIWRFDEAFLIGVVVAAALAELNGTPVIDDSGLLKGERLREPGEVFALVHAGASLREAARRTRRALGLRVDDDT